MSGLRFVVNVTGGIFKRGLKVHAPHCRWAKKIGRFYLIDSAALARVSDRINRGDGGGIALCKACMPLAVAGLIVDGT